MVYDVGTYKFSVMVLVNVLKFNVCMLIFLSNVSCFFSLLFPDQVIGFLQDRLYDLR